MSRLLGILGENDAQNYQSGKNSTPFVWHPKKASAIQAVMQDNSPYSQQLNRMHHQCEPYSCLTIGFFDDRLNSNFYVVRDIQ
jgi:hypothetical protein